MEQWKAASMMQGARGLPPFADLQALTTSECFAVYDAVDLVTDQAHQMVFIIILQVVSIAGLTPCRSMRAVACRAPI